MATTTTTTTATTASAAGPSPRRDSTAAERALEDDFKENKREQTIDIYRKSMRNGKRDRIEIYYSVVSLAASERRSSTEVMFRCNLSYDQLVQLRRDLVELGLVEVSGVDKRWIATQKGFLWIAAIETAIRMLAE